MKVINFYSESFGENFPLGEGCRQSVRHTGSVWRRSGVRNSLSLSLFLALSLARSLSGQHNLSLSLTGQMALGACRCKDLHACGRCLSSGASLLT